ncbi:MAG: NFACT family protein [Lactobacillales bacterium]|jgi:predicted ribosome quality control (RQC) complex YloA/Tae2 family protein|nr:NFACT family protein [Lactobacillales bacterium]
MSFDGIFIHALVHEIQENLLHGRIQKVHQPYSQEVVLIIRANAQNHKLLLSSHSSYARVQLTTMQYHNPETPPNFVMVLRKYLEGSILESIEQVENDRILHFTFTHRDELGDLQNIVLIVEIMGRHSNIILLNKETGKILDAIKHISLTQNTYRAILPGVEYLTPPKAKGKNPFTLQDPELFEILSTAQDLSAQFLQQNFQGFGRDTAEELVYRLKDKPNEKLNVWHNFFASLTSPRPSLYGNDDKEWFAPIAFLSLGKTKTVFNNLNKLLDVFFTDKAEKDRTKQQAGSLLHRIKVERKKNQTKLKKLHATLKDTENAENYRRKGELLTTFMRQVPKGSDFVELKNYYEEDKLIKILLKPSLSPNQNAQKYFQKYQKLKKSVRIVQEQIEQTKQEILYLESVESQLELATPVEIPIIFEELQAEGYIKARPKRKKREKPSQPAVFQASDETKILVGKNNLQNDRLTLKMAKKTDYWLHAKNIPGSHVIVESSRPSDETLTQAGILAAYYSKYRYSAQVPVDVVQVKHLRKPNGAKAGFVIYEGQKTILVTPNQEMVEKLKK